MGLEGQFICSSRRVICGLQVDKIPDVQPTEPAIWIDELVDPEELPEEPKQEEPDPHIGIPDSIPNSEEAPVPPLEEGKEGQNGRPGKGPGIT